MNGSNLSNESAQVTFGSSVAPDDFWATGKVLWFGAITIALIVLVVGNGLVLYCITYCRFLQNPADIFVAVLAGVDLTFAISMVMGLVDLVKPMVFTGLRACQFKLILAISNSLASGFALLGKGRQYFSSPGGQNLTDGDLKCMFVNVDSKLHWILSLKVQLTIISID